jgi:hypothetical protein
VVYQGKMSVVYHNILVGSGSATSDVNLPSVLYWLPSFCLPVAAERGRPRAKKQNLCFGNLVFCWYGVGVHVCVD